MLEIHYQHTDKLQQHLSNSVRLKGGGFYTYTWQKGLASPHHTPLWELSGSKLISSLHHFYQTSVYSDWIQANHVSLVNHYPASPSQSSKLLSLCSCRPIHMHVELGRTFVTLSGHAVANKCQLFTLKRVAKMQQVFI